MRDLVFLTVVVGFFAIAVAYVTACGSIVGRTDAAPAATGTDETDDARTDAERVR